MTSTTRRFGATLLAVACACGAASAWAHDDAAIAKLQAPHGGQMRVAGPYHFELVLARDGDPAAERQLVLHVTDHDGRKIDTRSATGSATLLAAKTRASVSLAPAGDNRMQALVRYAASADLKAVVSFTLPGKAAEQARFTPFAGKAP